jgi:hypothetical protein
MTAWGSKKSSSYELKKRRSRMGKGTHRHRSWIHIAAWWKLHCRARKLHWQLAKWRAGTVLVAGEQGWMLVAGGRRAALAASPRGDAARCGNGDAARCGSVTRWRLGRL